MLRGNLLQFGAPHACCAEQFVQYSKGDFNVMFKQNNCYFTGILPY